MKSYKRIACEGFKFYEEICIRTFPFLSFSFRACPTSLPIYIEMKLQHYYADENCRQLLPFLKHGIK